MKRANQIGLLLFFSTPLMTMAKETLTWEASVELATKNSSELKVAESNLQAVRYQEGSARSGFLPQITGSVQYTRGGHSPDNPFAPDTSTYATTLSASQNLFSGFLDKGKVEVAQANIRASEATLQTTKAKVSDDLKVAFEGVAFSKEYEKLTLDIIHRREENLRLVELHFESGLENKGSTLLSEANLEEAKFDHLRAKNTEQSDRALLAKILGLEIFDSFDIQGDIPIQEPSSLPDFKRLALLTPDHDEAVAQEDSAQASVVVSRSGFFPTLGLTGSIGKEDEHFLPKTEQWSVGANLTFPLFNGGKDYYSLKSALSTWSSSMSNRENIDQSLLAKLVQSYNSYVEAVEKLKVDESFRKAALVRADIARSKYNNGLLTFEDWDIIENDLISRQTTYLQSQRDRVIAEAAWEQTQGKGVIP